MEDSNVLENIMENIDEEMDWIDVNFTENDLDEFNTQDSSSSQYDTDDDSLDDMSLTRWEKAKHYATLAVLTPIILPIAVTVVIPTIVGCAAIYLYAISKNENQ